MLAFFGFLVATLLLASVSLGLAPLGALVDRWPLFVTMFVPKVSVAVVLIRPFEETRVPRA